MADNQELIEVEKLDAEAVFSTPEAIEPILVKIEEHCRSIVQDVSTEEGREAIKSLAYKIARTKTAMDNLRKKVVADWKAKAKAVDAVGNTAWDRLEALQKEIRQPVTEIEEAEKSRILGHETALQVLEECGQNVPATLTVEEITSLIERVEGFAKREWEEFTKKANEAHQRVKAFLDQRLTERRKYDADQAELATLRSQHATLTQQQRDNALVEQGRQQGAAEVKATVAAVVPGPAEDPTTKQKRIVNNQVLGAIMALGISEAHGKIMVKAIAEGKIPNVSIKY